MSPYVHIVFTSPGADRVWFNGWIPLKCGTFFIDIFQFPLDFIREQCFLWEYVSPIPINNVCSRCSRERNKCFVIIYIYIYFFISPMYLKQFQSSQKTELNSINN